MSPGIISWALFSGSFPHLDGEWVLDRICNRMFEPAAKHIGEFTRYNMHRPTRDQGQGQILKILGRWDNQEFVADLQSVQQLECLQVGFGMWAPKLWAARMEKFCCIWYKRKVLILLFVVHVDVGTKMGWEAVRKMKDPVLETAEGKNRGPQQVFVQQLHV